MADFDQRDQKVKTQYNADSININHSVPPEVIDDLRNTLHLKDKVISRLLHTLDEKVVALEDRESKLRDMAQQYTEIEARLAKRDETDTFSKQAKEKLDEGDLEGAEALLNQSLAQNLKQITEKKKAAAADAFELAKIRELNLDYQGALPFYEQAVELAPDDSLYLNDLGFLLHTLGEVDQAITFYKKALAPSTARSSAINTPMSPSDTIISARRGGPRGTWIRPLHFITKPWPSTARSSAINTPRSPSITIISARRGITRGTLIRPLIFLTRRFQFFKVN